MKYLTLWQNNKALKINWISRLCAKILYFFWNKETPNALHVLIYLICTEYICVLKQKRHLNSEQRVKEMQILCNSETNETFANAFESYGGLIENAFDTYHKLFIYNDKAAAKFVVKMLNRKDERNEK